jgi:hypothetical protein
MKSFMSLIRIVSPFGTNTIVYIRRQPISVRRISIFFLSFSTQFMISLLSSAISGSKIFSTAALKPVGTPFLHCARWGGLTAGRLHARLEGADLNLEKDNAAFPRR